MANCSESSIIVDDFHQKRIYRITVDGELNFNNHHEFSGIISGLISKDIYRIIVDFSRLAAIDSVGIGVLIKYQKLMQGNNGEMVIIGAREQIMDLFIPINLNKILTFFRTLDEGLRYLSV